MALNRDKLITYVATNLTTRLLKAYSKQALPEDEKFFIAESSICIADYVIENNIVSVWQKVNADYVTMYLKNKSKSAYDLIEEISDKNTSKYKLLVNSSTTGTTLNP